MTHYIDPALKEYATERQAQYIDVTNELGSARKAAKRLKVHHRAVQKGIKAVEKKALRHGYSASHGMNRVVPSPYVARGHSFLDKVMPDGSEEMVLRWTKTTLSDQQFQEALARAVEVCAQELPKPVLPKPVRGKVDEDVVPWINIGDGHLGMLAHKCETGYDWNLEIARRELTGGFAVLIDELPHKYERIVIQDMGDMTHYDNASGVTEKSRHALDNHLTYIDMFETQTAVMRFMIEKALEKARNVDVIINQGNHSRTNDWTMAVLLRSLYENDKRINILCNRSPFICYRMGDTLVLSHHSDQVKPGKLADIMTTDYRELYGQTRYHYIDIGHIHHEMVCKQHPSVRVESFNQLARADKYAHWNGYRNRSSITMIFRSRTFGETGRRTLGIDELQTLLYGAPIEAYRPAFIAA